jgi:hypothetical protein
LANTGALNIIKTYFRNYRMAIETGFIKMFLKKEDKNEKAKSKCIPGSAGIQKR